jgi:hypothetical protein
MYTDLAIPQSQQGNNFGGGNKLLFAPREYFTKSVTDFTDKSTGLITEDFLDHIIPPPMLDKLSSPAFAPESLQYIEKQNAAEAGSYISIQIKAIVFNDNNLNQKAIESMRFREFVVFYQGQNYEPGYWKIIGDKEKGMSFSSEFNSGETLRESASWQVIFALNSRFAPLMGYFPTL